MKAAEQERRDWIVIVVILLFGFLCVIFAGQWALRFSPSWKLDTSMESNLDPNSDFLTRRPSGFVEPIDISILTKPAWINVFLTPSASFITRTSFPTTTSTSLVTSKTTPTSFKIPTPTAIASMTNTGMVIASPTKTIIYFPPASPTLTRKPKPSSTAIVVLTATVTSTLTSTPTSILTSTLTSTTTATLTPTSSPTPTFTSTPDPGEPDFGAADGSTTTLGNGMSVEFNLSGFFLDGNSAWDVVYYEKEEASASNKIHLGGVLIEVYDQTTASWYAIFNWGDGIPDTNVSYNNGNSEPDAFPVDKTLLYGIPPLNTGIAMDIDTPAIGQGGAVGDPITKIRITSLSNANCDIDALQMLR
jgi:hypothetical protein